MPYGEEIVDISAFFGRSFEFFPFIERHFSRLLGLTL